MDLMGRSSCMRSNALDVHDRNRCQQTHLHLTFALLSSELLTRPLMKRISLALSLLILTVDAAAQVSIERFNRQLEQIQRETTLKADTSVPFDQRTLIDYGGYLTLSYLTVEDLNRETHVLRE